MTLAASVGGSWLMSYLSIPLLFVGVFYLISVGSSLVRGRVDLRWFWRRRHYERRREPLRWGLVTCFELISAAFLLASGVFLVLDETRWHRAIVAASGLCLLGGWLVLRESGRELTPPEASPAPGDEADYRRAPVAAGGGALLEFRRRAGLALLPGALSALAGSTLGLVALVASSRDGAASAIVAVAAIVLGVAGLALAARRWKQVLRVGARAR